MKPAFIALILFLILIVTQLFVPFNLLLNRDQILSDGHEFTLKTGISDSRGGVLPEISLLPDSLNSFVESGAHVFVSLEEDADGSACCYRYSLEKPAGEHSDYIHGIAVKNVASGKTIIEFPFLRELTGSLKRQPGLGDIGAEIVLVVLNGNAVVKEVRKTNTLQATAEI